MGKGGWHSNELSHALLTNGLVMGLPLGDIQQNEVVKESEHSFLLIQRVEEGYQGLPGRLH